MSVFDGDAPDLDLGSGHSLFWITVPDVEWAAGEHFGAHIRHPVGPHPHGGTDEFWGTGWCVGGITFDTPQAQAWHAEKNSSGGPFVAWQVQSWDPLTISPSVLCDCGDHGFIRDGKWVSA